MKQQFGAFKASELFCPKCQRSQPVRERLLLLLPTGELHEYRCSRCSTSVGTRTVSAGETRPPVVLGPRPASAKP